MKKWSVFIYANGNNELEPEIWEVTKKLIELEEDDEVHIIVQIGRQERSVTSLIRPNEDIMLDEECWSGVRRYAIHHNYMEEIETLGPINMADPNNLYDFLKWGKTHYEAEHYAFIIGGHIYQFVGMIPDFTQEKPYLMGFPEFSFAVQKACEEEGFRIDLLVLDTCYATSYELLCEWAQYDTLYVDMLLSYRGKGPVEGMPYNVIIEALLKEEVANQKEFAKGIIDQLHLEGHMVYPLLMIEMEPYKFRVFKQMFNDLATHYRESAEAEQESLSPYEIMTTVDKTKPWQRFVEYIQLMHNMIIIEQSRGFGRTEGTLPIHVLNKVIPDRERKALYKRLYFTKANAWAEMLCDEPYENKERETLEPLVLSKNVLHAFVANMNANKPEEEKQAITDALIQLKGWQLL